MIQKAKTASLDGKMKRRRRAMAWSFVITLVAATLLPLSGYVVTALAPSQAVAQESRDDVNPRAEYWREVRKGSEGYTSASGPYTTSVMVQNGGENWRQVRNGPVASITPWMLAIVLGAIALFYLWRGTKRVDPRPSGVLVERWSLGERVMHWYVAILFIILAITGLSLLFGRAVLIPVLGYQGFSAWATLAMNLHNYLGPFFMIGVVVEIVVWIRYNVFNSYDWEWFKQGGGMFKKGGAHPPAGRANAGEKVWFWIIATIGLIGVCVTGLILDFPNFGQTRETMQLANVLHASLGVLWIAIAFGHIYLGTLGVEGAFQGMSTGMVSREWMQQHHDKWYEDMKRTGRLSGSESAGKAPSGRRQTT
jgi:formate dehydrogenase subunit gamma